MTFRPHPKQAEFMREPPKRIIMAGTVLPRARGISSGSWSADAFAHDATICRRPVEVVHPVPEGATGIMTIDLRGIRPCGGRLTNGKCEFCDVTTIEEGR